MFYCNDCKCYEPYTNYNDRIHSKHHTWSNCRGGYGRPIRHIKCPSCGNPLSGFIMTDENMDEDDLFYFKDTLTMYQIEENGYFDFREGDRFKSMQELKDDLLNKLDDRNKKNR